MFYRAKWINSNSFFRNWNGWTSFMFITKSIHININILLLCNKHIWCFVFFIPICRTLSLSLSIFRLMKLSANVIAIWNSFRLFLFTNFSLFWHLYFDKRIFFHYLICMSFMESVFVVQSDQHEKGKIIVPYL